MDRPTVELVPHREGPKSDLDGSVVTECSPVGCVIGLLVLGVVFGLLLGLFIRELP